MRLRIKFSITIGDDEKATEDEDRYVDAMGTHHEAGEVDSGVGFTAPGLVPRWGDDA